MSPGAACTGGDERLPGAAAVVRADESAIPAGGETAVLRSEINVAQRPSRAARLLFPMIAAITRGDDQPVMAHHPADPIGHEEEARQVPAGPRFQRLPRPAIRAARDRALRAAREG